MRKEATEWGTRETGYSETSASIITRRHIPEDDILHSHRREDLKSYITLTAWSL
jgi:hypothetical protein